MKVESSDEKRVIAVIEGLMQTHRQVSEDIERHAKELQGFIESRKEANHIQRQQLLGLKKLEMEECALSDEFIARLESNLAMIIKPKVDL